MVTPEESGRPAGLSARHMYRVAEAGPMHFAETSDGRLLVCPNAVAARIFGA